MTFSKTLCAALAVMLLSGCVVADRGYGDRGYGYRDRGYSYGQPRDFGRFDRDRRPDFDHPWH